MAKKFKYKAFQDPFESEYNRLTQQRNEVATSYDAEKDPQFVAARDSFKKEQGYVSESARARMNATVGGTGSGSATATAMAQVNNDYLMRIQSLIPVYKQQALDSLDAQIERVQKATEAAYEQYNDKRQLAYDDYVQTREFEAEQKKDKRDFQYKKAQDKQAYEYKKKTDKQAYALQLANAKRAATAAATTAKKASSSSGSGSSSSKSSVTSSAQFQKNVMKYIRFLWGQDTGDLKSAARYTFNYIRSFGLSRKEELAVIQKLDNLGQNTPLAWYKLLGYDKR